MPPPAPAPGEMRWGRGNNEIHLQNVITINEVSNNSFSQTIKEWLWQWQFCTSYRMIYFLYEVNCCFLSILLHKYLILCFFTSYSREIIIRKKNLGSSISQMHWLLTIPIASLYSDGCMPKTNRHVTCKRMSTSWDTIWYCLHFKGKQCIYFIFYPFSLNLIHIYRIFCR